MQLFQLKNYEVIFEPITMMIEEFKAIQEKNNDENLTLKEICFIWFYTDPRSDFISILDDKERMIEVARSIKLPDDWSIDETVQNAIDFYKDHMKTASSGLYTASITAAQFLEGKLKKPKELLEEVDAKGNKLYKLDNILNLISKIPDVMIKLHKAREQVIKEIEAKSQLKGNKEKAMFEDGI